MRQLRMTKYGLQENAIGLTVTWTEHGREHLARVTGYALKKTSGDNSVLVLQTAYFNGEQAPFVSPWAVRVLEERPEDFETADPDEITDAAPGEPRRQTERVQE